MNRCPWCDGAVIDGKHADPVIEADHTVPKRRPLDITSVTEQDEIEIRLCWCEKGYNGHNDEHSAAIEIPDRIYLVIRDSWSAGEPLMKMCERIWKVSRYYD